MPLSDDEKKEIATLVAEVMSKSQQSEQKQTTQQETNTQEQSLREEAKKQISSENEDTMNNTALEGAVEFNMNARDFIESNKSFLPETAAKIVETANGKKYDSATDKANDIRKNILEDFVDVKENIEHLPASMRAKVEKFNRLTESAKKRKSGEFWDIVEVGVELNKNIARSEQLGTINNNSDVSDFEKRYLELASKWENK